MKRASPKIRIEWCERGYECSSQGDRRFSAFYARLNDGRTIEQHYQCDVKAYDPGGTNWKLGKGRPPRDRSVDLWKEYLALWKAWAEMNIDLMRELRGHAERLGGKLSDKFGTTPVNQAHALAEILNEEANGLSRF